MSAFVIGFLPAGIGPTEMIVFGIIALLLFGKNLPDVAKSLGKGLVEFKKGMRGIQDEIEGNSYNNQQHNSYSSSRPIPEDDRLETTAPKFEPPKYEPVAEDTPTSKGDPPTA